MKKIRNILSIILSVILLLNLSITALASESENAEGEILLTEDLALDLATNYAAVFTDKELVPCNPTRIYDLNDQAIGYIVELYYQDELYGYLVFDNNVEGLLAEISLDTGGNTLEESMLEKNSIDSQSMNSEEKIYKLDTAIYGVPTDEENQFITNYNDIVELPEANINNARSNKPSSWNDVFIDKKYTSSNMYFSSTGHLPEFIAYDEATVESKTKHYACFVSATMTCATYGTLATDYMSLWKLTNTSVDKVENKITYGSTDPATGVSGFKTFCNQKLGLTITSSDIINPSLAFFRTAINRGDIGMVHCGIKLAEGRSGHSMAVEGYAQIIVNKTTTFNTAMVSNGWDNGVHYLNLDTSQYSDIAGTVFKL